MATSQEALALGPVLRYVDATTATVWAETSRPADVAVLGRRSRTFEVEGHHYALVVVDGLAPGTDVDYSVELDGAPVWPAAGDHRPPPRIRTPGRRRDLEIVFGSCRIDRPNEEPWTLPPGEHDDAVGVDALIALSRALQARRRPLPDLMLLLGDQVYADKRLAPAVAARLLSADRREARSRARPGELAAANFEEYTWVYRSSWSQPDVRWLLATVPSAMVFDDHEVRDNWNISAAWRRDARRTPGWQARITGAFMAYWLYQHLGNLSPAALTDEGLWPALTGSPGGEARLREFAGQADEEVDARKRSRWSYRRDLGRVRLAVVDSRAGRILETGRRDMLGEPEWDLVEEWLRGDCDHLLIATSLPFLIERGVYGLEAWNEALSEGAWGRRVASWSERLRRAGNIEQWPAFQRSFHRLMGIVADVAAGRRGEAPATVLVLSGDVHHSYVARLAQSGEPGGGSPVVQVVSSPVRNDFPGLLRRGYALADSLPARLAGRLLARSVGARAPGADWAVTAGPVFGSFVASVRLAGRDAEVLLERAERGDDGPELRLVHREAAGAAAL